MTPEFSGGANLLLSFSVRERGTLFGRKEGKETDLPGKPMAATKFEL